MGLLKLGRCAVCDWPLAATVAEGCTIDSCSYRPYEGTPEYARIQERRLHLAQLRDRVKADNDLIDEIERTIEADKTGAAVSNGDGGAP